MPVLLPDGDVNVSGWANEAGGASVWDHLAGAAHATSHRHMVKGPTRVLMICSDDGARYPLDFGATMTAGPRAGQNPRHNTLTRIIQRATNFVVGRTDHSPCSPGRAAFTTGLWANNHFNTAVLVQQYYDYIRTGIRDLHCYDGTKRYPGPIEHDFALLSARAFFVDVHAAAAAWVSGQSYSIGDKISYNGRFYTCNTGTSSALPTDTGHWTVDVAEWSSGSTYTAGQKVAKVVNSWDAGTQYALGQSVNDGADGHRYTAKTALTTAGAAPHSTSSEWDDDGIAAPRYFVALASTTAGKVPEVTCDLTLTKWRDYGTLNAATLMLAQQTCPPSEQPYGDFASGARALQTARGDGCPEVWQASVTYKTNERVRYGTHQYQSKNNTNLNHVPFIGGTGSDFWLDEGVWCDDLQMTGQVALFLSQTGRVRCYEFEKTQNGVGQLLPSQPPFDRLDPATATADYWVSGTAYTVRTRAGDITHNSVTVPCPTATAADVGRSIIGTGIDAGTTITGCVANTSYTISRKASGSTTTGSALTFTIGDVVAFDGYFYACNTNTSSVAPATGGVVNTSNWTLMGLAYTDRHVSPGWLRKVISADDQQDHYRNIHIDFDAAIAAIPGQVDTDVNPAWGAGQIGRTSRLQYDWEIAPGGLTYNPTTHKVTVVTQTPMTGDPALVPGQYYDISIDAWGANPINAGGATNWVEPEVSALCIDSSTFEFTPTSWTNSATAPAGSPVLTHAFVYVRQWFETYWYGVKHAEILADISQYDNLFVYHGTHMPHASITDATVTPTRLSGDIQCERRYGNTLYSATPNTQAWNWPTPDTGTASATTPTTATISAGLTGIVGDVVWVGGVYLTITSYNSGTGVATGTGGWKNPDGTAASTPAAGAFRIPHPDGVPGTYGPDVGGGPSDAGVAGHRATWADRQNMFASQDDCIGSILDAWDAKFGVGNYYVIMVDDNGFQYGGHHLGNGKGNATEDDSWVEPGGKQFLWENSVRISFFIAGPGFPEGVQSAELVELADLPLTILKMFEGSVPELLNHHAHTKRDGMAIQDKLAGLRPDRHQFCKGKYQQGSNGTGPGGQDSDHPKVVDKDGNTYIKLWTGNLADADTYNQLFLGNGAGSGAPDEIEYETVDHLNDDAGTIALGASLSAIMKTMMTGRWEPSLEPSVGAAASHTGRV